MVKLTKLLSYDLKEGLKLKLEEEVDEEKSPKITH